MLLLAHHWRVYKSYSAFASNGRCSDELTWEDFSDLSNIIPLLTRIYPNGSADVNQFLAAGGLSFVIKELLENGYFMEGHLPGENY